ncbi:YigZ family protein [Vibrio profundum]|uniref:YigZ family protein n=1 Tax=Vibrio profundum TaxID=2910247 RepID=UPI003D0D37E2
MKDQPYLIPSTPLILEEEIKKSVFITHLIPTSSIEAAKVSIEEVKREHASARHNCWGFVAGRPEDSMKWGFSDDGEPAGTAGKPILAQLSGSGVGELTAVVTRYYGGIRLGTGGLVKAYGGGVQQALKQLQTIEKKITSLYRLELDYGLLPVVQSIITFYAAEAIESDYSDRVLLIVEIDRRNVGEFTQAVINKSGAKVLVTRINQN